MPTLENLTQADLNQVLRSKSKSRARGYVKRVQRPVRAGNRLTAEVPGASLYRVEIQVDEGGIHAHCTCPYDWGGYCKHVGAVLLRWLETPSAFAVTEKSVSSTKPQLEVIPVDLPPSRQPSSAPFWLEEDFTRRRQADEEQLAGWLESIKMQELRRVVKKRDWSISGTRKADLVEQMIGRLIDPDEIEQALAGLDAEHRRVLWAMALLGSVATRYKDLERMAQHWGKLTKYQQIATYTGHLFQQGLALRGDLVSTYPPRIDFIPWAIARQLPPLPAEFISGTVELPSDQPASSLIFADPYPLLQAAHQILLMLEQSPTPLRTPQPRPRLEKFYDGLKEWPYDPEELLALKEQGRLQHFSDLSLSVPPPPRSLPDQAIERLAPLAGDETRLEFIYTLLVAAGLLQPGSPTTIRPEVKEQFLRRSDLAQRAILVRTYIRMANWSEMWELLRAKKGLQLRRNWSYSFFRPADLQAELVHLRQRVLQMLACLPDDRWFSLEALFDLMRQAWPQFRQFASASYYYDYPTGNWFLSVDQDHHPLSTDSPQAWDLAQGNFLRRMLAGPLHWLGLVDLSYKEGVLANIRFHGLADLYWDRVETPKPPPHAETQAPAEARPAPAQAVAIEGETITVDPSAVSAQAHSLLDRLARLDEVTSGRFVYRLDPQAVHEAFEEGVSLTDILEDWDRLIPVSMPDPIQARLADWWQAYGQARIYEDVTVIEFGDDYALAEMKAATSLEKYLIAEISPRLVLIPAEAVEFLSAELEKAGYTPKQTEQV